MLNDRNWERGNPLTNILTGTLAETGMGVAVGGGLGSLGGIRAPRASPSLPRTGDILAHRGTPADRMDAWRAYRADNPDADMRRFLRQFDEAVTARLAAESADAAIQRRLRGELLAGIPPRQRGRFAGTAIEIMSDADFKALTRSDSGNAVTIIENGRPKVILRDGAPPSVLREEGIHLQQIADPELGSLARRLDESRLGEWDDLPLAEKLELYAIKLELEIDAQIRLIDGLDVDIGRGGPHAGALRRQRAAAAESLANLRRRAHEVVDIGPFERIAMARGLRDPPAFLDQPARLFNKLGEGPPAIKSDPAASRSAVPPDKSNKDYSPLRNDPVFDKASDSVEQVGEAWVEKTEVRLHAGRPIEMTTGGKVRPIYVNANADGFRYRNGRPVDPALLGDSGTTLVVVGRNNSRTPVSYKSRAAVVFDQVYREVEIVTGVGASRRVKKNIQEALSVNHADLSARGWVQRGTRNVQVGRDAELASARLSAEEAAQSGSQVIATLQIQRPNGTGFDQVDVRIDPDGAVFLTVIEVKHLPGHYASYGSFTAISSRSQAGATRVKPGNLEANLQSLQESLRPTARDWADARARATAREADLGPEAFDGIDDPDAFDFKRTVDDFEATVRDEVHRTVADRLGVTPEAYLLALNALNAGNLELLIRLTPHTKIGRSGKNNLFDRLFAEWQALVGTGLIRRLGSQRSQTMAPHLIDESAAAVAAVERLHAAGRLPSDGVRPSGIRDAPYVDDNGDLMSIGIGRPGESAGQIAASAAAALRTRHALPNGFHADARHVIDLSNMPGDRAALMVDIEAAFDRLGLTPAERARVVFIDQR